VGKNVAVRVMGSTGRTYPDDPIREGGIARYRKVRIVLEGNGEPLISAKKRPNKAEKGPGKGY